MEIVTFQNILIGCFLITFILGFVVFKTNFCTMGAVSDVVNIGDYARMKAWFFAIALSIFGVAILNYLNLIQINLATSSQSSNPPYLNPNLVFLRHILGGIFFGIGMTLASGCGNRTLVRIGGGNIKSIFVFITMGYAAYLMIFTNFGFHLFTSWMMNFSINLASFGYTSQSFDHLITAGLLNDASFPFVSIFIAILILYFCFKSGDFHKSYDNLLAGGVLGIAVIIAWYLTAGELGLNFMEEAEFLEGDQKPYASGVQSLTFVQPSAVFIRFVETGLNSIFINFSLIAALGIVLGSMTYAILFKKFRIEWFSSFNDFINHIVGGFLMGVGGVLALGCTIGQGVSGMSTLAIGSILSLTFIIFGSAITMKIQLYKMVYEDCSYIAAFVCGMCDLRLLPNGIRKFDPVS